jgi:hypothetical protein
MTAFPLGAVLSVSTGIFVADDFGQVQELMSHLVGESLFAHSLPRVAKPCAAEVLRQHPALAEIPKPALSGREECDAWVAAQVERFGAELEIAPMAPGAVAHIDPIQELADRIGADRVIAVVTEES